MRDVMKVTDVSDDLIVWSAARDWHRKTEGLLADLVSPTLKRRLRLQDPDRFFEDDFKWLRAAGEGEAGHLLQLLADRLLSFRVRLFHACRPRDVESYFAGGLRCLRPEEALVFVRELIERFEELAPLRNEARLLAEVDRLAEEKRGGLLYLGLDDRDLLDGAGHYLIYGSEYVSGILATGGLAFQQVLTREGIPTVFVVDVPAPMFSAADLKQFANLLLARWAQNMVRRRRSAPEEDFTFELRCDIPPSCIVGHYHPRRINDPLNVFKPYRVSAHNCPRCSG
jgi:hypothetical protein